MNKKSTISLLVLFTMTTVVQAVTFTSDTISWTGGGAGYSGSGGSGSSGGSGGVTYPSITEPVELGSGGGQSSEWWNAYPARGGAGGGLIRLTVGGICC